MKMKMVFVSCCNIDWKMHLVLFSGNCIMKMKTIKTRSVHVIANDKNNEYLLGRTIVKNSFTKPISYTCLSKVI